MDRRQFLQTGAVAAGLALAASRAPAAVLRPGGRAFVEVMVPAARLRAGSPVSADRRCLIGLSASDDGSRSGRPRSAARWVLSGSRAAQAGNRGEMQDGNDRLAALCSGGSGRLSAFADLTASPTRAAQELARCVTVRRMLGGTLYLGADGFHDQIAACRPVFEAAQALRAPLTLAPADPPGYGWSSSLTEALVTSGCLERFRDLTIIIDHVDDELAFCLTRIDQRLAAPGGALRRRPSAQIRAGVFYTTNGLNYHPALGELIRLMGSDRVLFASDRAFAYDPAAVAAALALPAADIERIMGGNAERLFGLS